MQMIPARTGRIRPPLVKPVPIVLLFVVILGPAAVCGVSGAGAPAIEWQKCLGGTGNDYSYSVEQTSDGGYVLGGLTYSVNGDVTGNHGLFDYWVVKLNSTGGMEWEKCLGGTWGDYLRSVCQTADGGYILGGFSFSSDGNVTDNSGQSDYWIVKLNSTGDLEWEESYGGSQYDDAYSIRQVSDGGYIVAGSTTSSNGDVTGNHGTYDFWIAKLNGGGGLSWQKCLGGSEADVAYSIRQVPGGYVVAGMSRSNDGNVTGNHGGSDFWVAEITDAGGIAWQDSYGGMANEEAFDVNLTTDGGYIVAGYTESDDGNVTGNHGGSDFWVLKLSGVGTIDWKRCFGGTGDDKAYSVAQTGDGGYVVLGYTGSMNGNVSGKHGSHDYWVVKLSPDGALEWQKCLGGSSGDFGYCIGLTDDRGFVVTGKSSSNNGNVTGNHGADDYWVVKLAEPVIIPSVSSITPDTGVRGTTVAITDLHGADFTGAPSVNLTRNGMTNISAEGVALVSPDQLTCTFSIPSGAATGQWNVVVTNPDARSGTLANGFTITDPAPAVGSITPSSGKRGKTVSVTGLNGTNFSAGAKTFLSRGTAKIRGRAVTVINETWITCSFRIPSAAATGKWDVKVTSADGQSGVKKKAFRVRA